MYQNDINQQTTKSRAHPRPQDAPRKLQKVVEDASNESYFGRIVDHEYPEQKFDLSIVEKFTHKKFIAELTKVNNNRELENFTCFGLDRAQQKEFMTMLMRYGFKGRSLSSLYKMVQTLSKCHKRLKLMDLSEEYFVNYGNRILEFIEFQMLSPKMSNIPHFILNYNSAEKVKYCIRSIQMLERVYANAELRSDC